MRRFTSSTNKTLISLVLLQHPSEPATAFQPSALASNSHINTDPRRLRQKLYRKIAELQARANSQLKGGGTQSKRHYDARKHVEPEFLPNQLVFNDKLPFTDKTNTADEMAEASYKKLQPRKAGPFQTIKMQPHTVVLDGKGLPNTVSIYRVTAALGLRGQRPETAWTPN